MIQKEKIFAYALENALLHDGKSSHLPVSKYRPEAMAYYYINFPSSYCYRLIEYQGEFYTKSVFNQNRFTSHPLPPVALDQLLRLFRPPAIGRMVCQHSIQKNDTIHIDVHHPDRPVLSVDFACPRPNNGLFQNHRYQCFYCQLFLSKPWSFQYQRHDADISQQLCL